MHIAARNTKELQVSYLVTNGTRTMCCIPHHFYTNVHVLASFITFYDGKPQPIKNPLEGKPSTISPNHTCYVHYYVMLSYDISLSHFFIAHYL